MKPGAPAPEASEAREVPRVERPFKIIIPDEARKGSAPTEGSGAAQPPAAEPRHSMSRRAPLAARRPPRRPTVLRRQTSLHPRHRPSPRHPSRSRPRRLPAVEAGREPRRRSRYPVSGPHQRPRRRQRFAEPSSPRRRSPSPHRAAALSPRRPLPRPIGRWCPSIGEPTAPCSRTHSGSPSAPIARASCSLARR